MKTVKLLFAALSLMLAPICNGQNGTYQANTTALTPYTDLASALTTVSTAQATIHVNKNYTLTGNLTIPENVSLKFYNGFKIKPNGFILTINGAMDAGAFQIFDMSSGGTTKGAPLIADAMPEWWQADINSSWTKSIQYAVDFYPSVYFQARVYKMSYISGTGIINLPKNNGTNLNHFLHGSGDKTILTSADDKYIFAMDDDANYHYSSTFENLYFITRKAIKMNNTVTTYNDENQINNLKVTRCHFTHPNKLPVGSPYYQSGAVTITDIALDFYEVFDSTISENLIEGYGIGIKLYGCDINSIHDNRIVEFKFYAIYDRSLLHTDSPANMTGSQTSIVHNDLLCYKGDAGKGAFIKSNNYHVIIRDNYMENAGLEVPNDVLAYVDCTNADMGTTSLAYNLEITGNRLSTRASFLYLLNEEFRSLTLTDISMAIPLNLIPPSSFYKNVGTGYNAANLVRDIPITYATRPRSINIDNVFSFREWRSFNNTNLFDNSYNAALIINPTNISDLAYDGAGGVVTFTPKSIKAPMTAGGNGSFRVQISQKISGLVGELNALPKRLKIKIITRNLATPSTSNNNDYFAKILTSRDDATMGVWNGFGSYLCKNADGAANNNYNTYVITPNIVFDATTDYWLNLAPQNNNKEIRCIIIEAIEECAESRKKDGETKEENIKDEGSKDENTQTLIVKVNNEVNLTPNPAQSILSFDIKKDDILKSVQVYTETGSFIGDYTDQISNNTIDISNLPNSTYIVKIVTIANSATIIIKE